MINRLNMKIKTTGLKLVECFFWVGPLLSLFVEVQSRYSGAQPVSPPWSAVSIPSHTASALFSTRNTFLHSDPTILTLQPVSLLYSLPPSQPSSLALPFPPLLILLPPSLLLPLLPSLPLASIHSPWELPEATDE